VRFLNLFCYTASATVYAAAGGARTSVSVDLSQPYLRWAEDNFRLNGLDAADHHLVRADCRGWLAEAARGHVPAEQAPPFDLILLDPPTFSNSRRMRGVLDVQRDHPALILACLQLLSAQGLLLFSTNAQRFRLEAAVTDGCTVTDISQQTLPFDFKRNPHIHRCFEIRKQP
jgi:23S rRNA (guanine2445-N2)-methyltransferase / 23S rRNA (guanine2069-N7)-methyltransferase